MWPFTLSGRLPVVALVGRYPTNQLIGHEHLIRRIAPFYLSAYGVLAAVSNCCPPPNGSFSCITHPSATNIHFSKLPCMPVQLACVKHAASVRPEPGSNSQISASGSLFYLFPSPIKLSRCNCVRSRLPFSSFGAGPAAPFQRREGYNTIFWREVNSFSTEGRNEGSRTQNITITAFARINASTGHP